MLTEARKNRARCKQEQANAASPTGVYKDVHEQEKTPTEAQKIEQDASKTRRGVFL